MTETIFGIILTSIVSMISGLLSAWATLKSSGKSTPPVIAPLIILLTIAGFLVTAIFFFPSLLTVKLSNFFVVNLSLPPFPQPSPIVSLIINPTVVLLLLTIINIIGSISILNLIGNIDAEEQKCNDFSWILLLCILSLSNAIILKGICDLPIFWSLIVSILLTFGTMFFVVAYFSFVAALFLFSLLVIIIGTLLNLKL